MPDDEHQPLREFRIFLDGEEILEGDLILTISPRDGMLCTLNGKMMRPVALVYDEASGEIGEVHLEEVRE